MRTLRKIILIVFIVTGIFLVAATILGRVFEDELTQYVLSGLNQQIRTEVKIKNLNLSFLKKFPDASLEFKDVFVSSVPDYRPAEFGDVNTDTLLYAKKIFLRFNILKLFQHKYLIREVQIQSGKLNIFIDRTGKGNYQFWENNQEKEGKNFLLELQDVNLDDIMVGFDNRALEIDIDGFIKKSHFSGKFSRETYSMSVRLDGMLHRYDNHGAIFLREQKISSSATLMIDPQSIQISEGDLLIAGQHLMVSGNILRPSPLDFNLHFEGRQLDLENVLRFILLNTENFPKDLRAGGDLDFSGEIKGIVSNTKMPGINSGFTLENGWIQSSALPKDIEDIRFRGGYSNGILRGPQSTLVELNDVSVKMGNSRCGGNFSMLNLIRPAVDYNIKADLDLSDVYAFIPNDSIIEEMQGKIHAEIQIKGGKALLSDLKKQDFLDYAYRANIWLENASLKLRKLPFRFNEFSGQVLFTDHLEIKSLSGTIEESRISTSGRVDNFLEFLLSPKANLWIDADLYSEKINLNYFSKINSGKGAESKTDSIFLPDRLYLKTRFWVDEFLVKEFKARQVTGNLIYKPRRLSINHLELLSMNGRVESEGFLEQQKDLHFLVKSMSNFRSVDITEVFRSFNNFGQDFISDQQISGMLSGTVNFSAGLDQRMKIDKKTILSDCDVVIRNGALSNFDPMLKLSKFIDVEELEEVHFETISNEIYIRNEEVLIPKMDIHSSAFDITASGVHGFDMDFTYKVKVALSEIMSKKPGKITQQESEFGRIEDDGLGKVFIYLIIEGNSEETVVRYDRKGAVENVRSQMNEEKKELKQILNEEFGFFRKDSSILEKDNDGKKSDFMIKWEEDMDSIPGKREAPGNISEKERFIIEWDDDEEEPEEAVPESKKILRKKKK